MTPDELRIRCAEIDLVPMGIEIWCHALPERGLRYNIPDYCNSIDAINAAVLRLDVVKRLEWNREIWRIVDHGDTSMDEATFAIATASALDRATAFAAIFST